MTTEPERRCTIAGCTRPHHARGWCLPHYRRWKRRGGDPAITLPNAAAQKRAQTHCIHGHALTPDNVYRSADGRRNCKTCIAERAARYRAEWRALRDGTWGR